jgi:glycosyltransferase involved in cell wall biosynthesis
VKPRVTAYVPCYNNAASVLHAIESLSAQTTVPHELFVVDDGSTDHSVEIIRARGIRVIGFGKNTGRGAVRARAMSEASGELVLCCDATNELAPDFLARSLHWFADDTVSAVFGRWTPLAGEDVVQRWRNRHLFKIEDPSIGNVRHGASLSTHGCLIRKSHVISVGGFDSTLRHMEDRDIGNRLLNAGFDVIYDPNLLVLVKTRNVLTQVLERFWRWHADRNGSTSLKAYARMLSYSVKVMARADLARGEVDAAAISILLPHYQFWKAKWTQLRETS